MSDLEARVKELEERLAAVEAVQEISNLKARYAELVDSRYTQEGPRPADEIGRIAAERAVERIGAKKPKTGAYPVLFDERVASALIGSLLQATNGMMIARGSSWLRDAIGEEVLPTALSVIENPHRARVTGSRLFDARHTRGRHTLRIIRLSSFPKAPQRRGNRTRDIPPGVGNSYSFLLGPMVILVGKGVLVLVDGRLRCTEQNVFESSVPLARKAGTDGASAAVTSLQANARVTPQCRLRGKPLRRVDVGVECYTSYPAHARQCFKSPDRFLILRQADQSLSSEIFLS